MRESLAPLLFAMLHIYPSLIIGNFLNAILYGWIYYRSRNVIACFLMHFTNNTVSYLADLFIKDNNIGSDIISQTRIIIIALFCLTFMAGAIMNLKRITSEQ